MARRYETLDDWIAREAIPFGVDSSATFNAAVDRVITEVGAGVAVLGLGEALHGGEDILILRNRLFQRLVEVHGYSAIAIESSFPRSRVVNEYVAGRGPASYEAIAESGFSYGFRRLEANRELVAWMREYNAASDRRTTLQFYGFDSPTEMGRTDSPRQLLQVALDYLAALDADSASGYRRRIEVLLGDDAAWENPAAMRDPTKAVGGSPGAAALRIETEELISALQVRRPALVERSDRGRCEEALHCAVVARQLLNYHAALARVSDNRVAELLGIRDAIMAENLAYIISRERDQGKVLVFAHNSHLQRGEARWQWGPDLHRWWPVGAHLKAMFGSRYAVIGSAVGVSEANGIGWPEEGTLEARLLAVPGPARFVPTFGGEGLPDAAVAALPTRSGSAKNQSYFPLNPRSFSDFDWFVMVDATGYSRGGPPLP